MSSRSICEPKSQLVIYVRFGAVGFFNALLYFGLAHMLYEYLGFGVVVATTIAFFIVVSLSFFISGRHVFYGKIGRASYLKYLATLLFILVLTNVIVFISDYYGVAYLNGQLFAAVVTVPLSFALSKFFVFASK